MKKNINKIKAGLIISAAAMAICILGIVLSLVMEHKWDIHGCIILACNAVIFSCNYDAYKDLKGSDNKE